MSPMATSAHNGVAYIASDDTATAEDELDLIQSDTVVVLPFHDAVVDLIDGDACVLQLVIRFRMAAAWGTIEQGRSDVALSLVRPIRQVVAQDRQANGRPIPPSLSSFLRLDGSRRQSRSASHWPITIDPATARGCRKWRAVQPFFKGSSVMAFGSSVQAAGG